MPLPLELDLSELLDLKKTSTIWDREVPVVQKDKTTYVYFTTEVQEPHVYNELCHLLNTAEKDEKFVFTINTPGGMIDSAIMLIQAIKNTKAHITARLSGTVASAGTIISMYVDTIEVSDHIAFMIHNYSAGNSGKGHEMKARQKFMDSQLETLFKDSYTGFLTDDEMTDVIDGRDMWIGKDEVLRRWEMKVGN